MTQSARSVSHIKQSWFPLIARLQAKAHEHNSCAIVSVSFLVDDNGEVLFYTEPAVARIEPRSKRDNVLRFFGSFLS